MRPARHHLVALAGLCLVSLGASCDRGPSSGTPNAEADAPAASAPAPAGGEAIESLEGVDTSQLTDAEAEMWTELVNERLSPCGDPVSVARCVAEKQKCGACTTAARYITRLVMEGYDKQTIEAHYTGRFDPGKKLDFSMDGAHVRGAPMAPITIVEFSDFQCPYCGAAAPELERLIEQHEGKVKLVFKHFPLSSHSRAVPAALAAEAAGRQGRFWEMHDLLFANQRTLEDADLARFAQTLGLDMDKFAADLASAEVKARIEADRAAGEKVNVEGTPSIFVNGRRFEEPFKELETYVAEQLEL
jgi:protein-disulfide isomerase